jgi:hypothetical protein
LYIYSADRRFDSPSDSRIDLRSGAMVEAQHPAEALGALDGGRRSFAAVTRLDQSIIEPLMIPLPVIKRMVSGVTSDATSV